MLSDFSIVVTLLCYYGAKVSNARSNGSLRLVHGSDYRTGRVEMFIEPNNRWGTICDDNWDNADARVVCNQLGFGNSGTALQQFQPHGASNAPIWLDEVNCNGHESRLIDCPHDGLENHNCFHFEDAGVICEGNLPRFPIRLVDGNNTSEGRIEIFHNNSWATVCGDGWDDTDAGVVCRQLGFGTSGSAVLDASFGEGSGTILLDSVSCIRNHSNIFDCPHGGFENNNCHHHKDAGVRCRDAPSNMVRLVGGSSYNEGRVELNYNGEWGTVCDDGWDDTDAGVVCRQLGFGSSGTAIGSAGFGQGSGSIWLDSVTCTGSEPTLPKCGHLGVGVTRICSHEEDAGVRCSGTQVVPVRLSGGHTSRSGRVEMYINGQWGTVCDDSWTTGSSNVVCRQLGLGNTGTFYHNPGPQSFPIHLDDIICDGSETNILACPHHGLGNHNCDHIEDVGVACSGVYDAPVRLAGGSNEREGRVEIMYQGIWGTICDDGWDDIDATVVCRELGYSHGNATRHVHFGSGTGLVWSHQVGCLGDESKLSHCIHPGAGNVGNCSHTQDAGVQCNGPNVRIVGGPTKYEGRVEVYYNGEWGTVCDDGWDLNDAQVVCSELGLGKATAAIHGAFYGLGSGQIWLDEVNCVGTERTIGSCSHRGWGIDNCFHWEDASINCTAVEPISNGTLRLAGSNSPHEGRVEMYIGDQWVRVCDDGWDDSEANVVCRQLGFGSSGRIQGLQGSGSRGVMIPNFSCFGNELMLLNCSHGGLRLSDCDLYEEVEVVCNVPVPALPIRLTDGNSRYSGRVEIYRNGVWGTVCDDNWTIINAQVVCRQLGYESSSASVDFNVPAGTGPILMDDVNCISGQANLLECSHNGFGNHNCRHIEDVGVTCTPPSTRPLIRLVGGSSYNEGRVEVNYNGEWGTVCDDGWDDTDAGVVCRQLGFGSSGTAIGSAGFDQGSGPIWLNIVMCGGDELTLAICYHAGVGVTGSCSHNNDAGVRCFGEQDFFVRVQSLTAEHPRAGRVEILNNGHWTLVCANGWDARDATVVCQEKNLGTNGTAIQIANNQTGRLWLSGVDCMGNELHLSSCMHSGIGVIEDCPFVAGVECFESPLIVTIDPSNVIAKVHQNVTFVCSAVGLGGFLFVWEHDGEVISAALSTLQQHSLTIHSVLPQHQGQYKCTVTSSYSNLTSEAFATLQLIAPSFDSHAVLEQISSNASANTITVFVPRIKDADSPISHYYIVVSLEQLEDTEAVKESELLPANQAKRNTDLPLYITASLNHKLLHQTFTIGDGSSSTDPTSQRTFYNVPLQKQQTYYYFIRAYSEAHTTQYPFFGTSKISSAIAIALEDPPSTMASASSSSSSNLIPAIVGVVIAVIIICLIAFVVLVIFTRRRKKKQSASFERDNGVNNPMYSGDPRTQGHNKNETTLPEYDEHIYDAICGPSEFEKEKQQHLETNNRASYDGNHYDIPQIRSKADDDDDADRISIKSNDIKYDDTEGQCTSDVKENKAYYSKNSKPKPQPKPRHSTKLTAKSAAPVTAAGHYDVPSNNHHRHPVHEGDYATLDVSHSHFTNAYQELVVHQPPPPGYAAPSNIPATSTTLESYNYARP